MRHWTIPTASTLHNKNHNDDDDDEGEDKEDFHDPFPEMNLAGSTAAAARWMTAEERQLVRWRRKARNRMSARRSRQRKKETLEQLERGVRELQREVEAWRARALQAEAGGVRWQGPVARLSERDERRSQGRGDDVVRDERGRHGGEVLADVVEALQRRVQALEAENAQLRATLSSLPTELQRLAQENEALTLRVARLKERLAA